MTAVTPHGPLSGFLVDDRMTKVAWTAAIALAVVVHSAAFVMASSQPASKAKSVPITMAISIPPSPPPPPPPPEPEVAKPKPPDVTDVKPPPPAPPAETPPPSEPAPTPKASEQLIALAPPTGQGVAVAVGTPDGVQGAPPPTSTGTAAENVPLTNRGQAGPVPADWNPNGYKSGAFEQMNKNKRYPRQAEVLGLEGKCVVVLKINHDGSLASKPTIVRPGSGHALLDEECIAMAERTTFPPIPAHVDVPAIFRIPIEFKLVNR